MESKTTKLDKLYADEAFNSRKLYEGIKELAEDMKANGQLVPILATKAVITVDNDGKGKHLIIAGYRRVLAAKKLGWNEISVQFIDQEPYSKEASITNCRENFARHDLSTFDQARALASLQEIHKMNPKELAEAFRASVNLRHQQIFALINAQKKLHPDIMVAWQTKHKLAITTNLFHLASLDHVEQLKEWGALLEAKGLPADSEEAARIIEERKKKAEEIKAEKKANGERTEKVHKPSEETRKRVFGLIGESELSSEVKKAARAVLLWVEGTPQDLSLAGSLIYSAQAEKDKAKAVKAEKKGASVLAQKEAKLAEQAAEIAALRAQLGK